MKFLKDIKDPISARDFLGDDFKRYLIGIAGYEFNGVDLIFDLEENEDEDSDEPYIVYDEDIETYDYIVRALTNYCTSRDLPTEWIDDNLTTDMMLDGETEWYDLIDLFVVNVLDNYRK